MTGRLDQVFASDGALREEWDAEGGRYRRWDDGGQLVEDRPLSDDEAASLAMPLGVEGDALATARDAMAGATTFAELQAAMLAFLAASEAN